MLASIPSCFGADGFSRGAYVYMLVSEAPDQAAFIKIGLTCSPLQRLQQLVQGLPLEPGKFAFLKFSGRPIAQAFETTFLRATRKWETRGEWRLVPLGDSGEFKAVTREVMAGFSKGHPLTWNRVNVREYRAQQARASKHIVRQWKRAHRRFMTTVSRNTSHPQASPDARFLHSGLRRTGLEPPRRVPTGTP